MCPPYYNLGPFHLSGFRPTEAAPYYNHFRDFLRAHGWSPIGMMNYRGHEECLRIQRTETEVRQFHRDCHGSNKYFAIWSNTGGTLIQFPYRNGLRLVIAGPHQVVVIDNHQCRHATPWLPGCKREFLRCTQVMPV